MRLTKNKLSILEALSKSDPDNCLEWGPPPRNAATVAAMLDKTDHRPIARTLRNMEAQGLVESETRPVDVWCQIAGIGHYPKKIRCYWSSRTKAQDKAAADEWNAGSKARSERALNHLLEKFYG